MSYLKDHTKNSEFTTTDGKSINISVTSFDSKNTNAIELLNNYRQGIYQDKGHRLIENYSPKRLSFEEQEVCTTFSVEGEIIGFTTVWNRPYFGKKTVRILNRFWHAPNFHVPNFTKDCLREHVRLAVLQQCQISYKKGFKWAMITREFNNRRFLTKFTNRLNELTPYNWTLLNKKICVTPDTGASSSWQYAIITRLDRTPYTPEYFLSDALES